MKTGTQKRKLLMIEWDDSASCDRWRHVSQLEKATPVRCLSVGWLMSSTPKAKTLASSLSFMDDEKEPTFGSGDITIPVGCIRRVRRIG